jgi:hypothetical protein
MLTAPFTVLNVMYPPPVVYVNLTASLTVLNIRCSSVVYVNLTVPLTVLNIRYPPVVYVNSSSHSCKHKVSISRLC